LLAAWKLVRLMRSHGYPTSQVYRFTSRNITSTAYVGHGIDIFKIYAENKGRVKFEIEYFPGARMKVFPGRKLTIIMFTSGKINITGSSNKKDTLYARCYYCMVELGPD
jgi:TATA-box binding protein (TBP) (component of TFIID and TFIIIB)